MKVVIHCTTEERAAQVEHTFPLRPNDRKDGIVYRPSDDDTAPYIVQILLSQPTLTLAQRASLLGRCAWYAYEGTPDALLAPIDLDDPETFATWLSFQEDSPDRTWHGVVQEYVKALSPKRGQGNAWWWPEVGAEKEHIVRPAWLLTLAELVTHAQHIQGSVLTKVRIQQLLEAVCEQDVIGVSVL